MFKVSQDDILQGKSVELSPHGRMFRKRSDRDSETMKRVINRLEGGGKQDHPFGLL